MPLSEKLSIPPGRGFAEVREKRETLNSFARIREKGKIISSFAEIREKGKIINSNIRLRLFGISLLLCVALISVIFAAVGTVQAYQQFQQDHQRIMAGDVSTVSSWMTLPYVSHVYHVPEGCLAANLSISEPQLIKHATLRLIADYQKRPVDTVIQDVRNVILTYRKKRQICGLPSPPAHSLASRSQFQLFSEEGATV